MWCEEWKIFVDNLATIFLWLSLLQSPGEPSSPQPSVDRLSVSFAPEYERERSSWSDTDYGDPHHLPPSSPGDLPSDVSVKVNVLNMNEGGAMVGGGGGSPSPVMPPGQGQSSPLNPGNRLSVVAVVSGLILWSHFPMLYFRPWMMRICNNCLHKAFACRLFYRYIQTPIKFSVDNF